MVGLLSSVIPYTCELVALRSLRPAVFSILMSLEPAAAALAGLIVLSEVLTRCSGGDGLRGRRQHRRHPDRRDHRRAGAGLTERSAEVGLTNCSQFLHAGVTTARRLRLLAS